MRIKRFPLGMLWTNCYVVASLTDDAVVIDPGGDTAEVREYLADQRLKLRWILLTHGHGDHIGGVGELRALASEGVAIGREDATCLSSAAENLSSDMGTPISFDGAERLLDDGDVLAVGGLTVRVIATPGHTRGGVSFYAEEQGEFVLFSGDTLFAGSVGRTDLAGGDEKTLNASLEKLTVLSDDLRVFPGHGPETTIGAERTRNPFWPR